MLTVGNHPLGNFHLAQVVRTETRLYLCDRAPVMSRQANQELPVTVAL